MLMKRTQRQWQGRSSYPFRRLHGLPYLPLIFMHHMIEMKEIPATVLVNFSKLMLHTFFIYRKWKIKAYWQTFQFCKPIYSSMRWSDEWCRQFVLISLTRAMLLQENFLQNRMVDPYATYGYNMGRTLQFQHSLPMSTIGRKNQYIKTFEFCAKNVV